MTGTEFEKNIERHYFDWLTLRIKDTKHPIDEQRPNGSGRLLRYLFETTFVYTIPMDGNRYQDGIDLRYRFGTEALIPASKIASILDVTDCSLLEMMLALAVRCSEHILNGDDYADGTPRLFWDMVESLGLDVYRNERFDRDAADAVIERLYRHGYSKNGKGGLVTVKTDRRDLRTMEIWDQMMMKLNEELYSLS